MTKLDKKTVEHIAKLSSLKFSSKDLSIYTKKFTRVLEYVEKLNSLDVTGVEPTSHALDAKGSMLGDDVIEKFVNVDGILDNSPEMEKRFFKVPKTVDR